MSSIARNVVVSQRDRARGSRGGDAVAPTALPAAPTKDAKPRKRSSTPRGQGEAVVEAVPLRRRGRPPKAALAKAGAGPQLSREQILDRAFELARSEPLGEISMVGLARELGVAPTLIHYYVGSHEDLISGVVNRYFRERAARMPELTGAWEEDLRADASHSFAMYLSYGGVLRYTMSHNRSRLFQRVGPGEQDFGMFYLDRTADILRRAGFSAQQAAMAYHLLALYVMSSAYAEVNKQLPAYHERYIREKISQHPIDQLVGAHYIAEAFAALDSESAFPTGLQLLIDGFAAWLKAPAVADAKAQPAAARMRKPRA